MKRVHSFLVLIVLIISCTPQKDSKNGLKVSEGVSLSLADYRAKHISEIYYHLKFDIPNEKNAPIASQLVLDFNVNTLDEPVYLDFKEETSTIKSVTINRKQVPIIHEQEHIVLRKKFLSVGKNTIAIDFIAGELSLNRNEDYLYTLLVPDRARTLFPCFDQPNLKGIYTLEITAPKNWKVLCGAPELGQEVHGNFIKHLFAPSDKMSTYLFSFVAGVFEAIQQKSGNRDMRFLYRETDQSKIRYSTDTIFNLHQQALEYLEEYTAYAFPFQKLDFAAIPGFQYGGMEHVGAIQYRENALFLDPSSTENQKLGRAKLIAHETAHMWFGDLVTMDWFNDVWMKEVFANFMADKIVNPAFPDINHQLAFMITHYPNAYGEDRTLGTNPIRQALENLNNAGSLYGSIIYNKAPIMMRQLELVLGKEAFQKGIQEYISTFAYDNAVWNDLIKKLDQKSDTDLEAWSKVWVNSSSRPIFKDSISYDKHGTIDSFVIFQEAEDKSRHIWPQTFDLSFIYPDSIKTITVSIKNSKLELQEVLGLPKPDLIVYNSNAEGYGVFPIQQENLLRIPTLKNEVARGYAYVNAYENLLNATIDPLATLELFRKSLASETNELLISLVSRYTLSIFWKYLTDDQRDTYQKIITHQLWAQLQENLPPNIKKTLFSTYRSVAYKDVSRENLFKIWNKDLTLKNLKLNEDDRTELAMDLVLYAHPEYAKILTSAKDAITNPDKLERFEFLRPSLSMDIQVRSKFFESMKQEKNRAKESWAATAMDHLNHPIHQKASIAYLRPSLDLLDEIQKTGDIFFPKLWLNSTIGNYVSAEAYQIVQDFLSDNPNLNPALKLKLLQASDDLRRVQLLHKKVDRSVN